MAFLAQIGLWIVGDIRHMIIVVLSILLIAACGYSVYMKWQVADKDQQIATYKTDNNRLALNNTNLTMQNNQLRTANTALQAYVGSILDIKNGVKNIKEDIEKMKGKEDEITNNNALANLWNGNKP